MLIEKPHLNILRQAYKKKNITLYLGAGTSVANGLPGWEKLVLAMYFAAISREKLKGWRPFPNYLFAIAEWHLNNKHEPLEITARRLHKYYSENEFVRYLHQTLYAGFLERDGETPKPLFISELRNANKTLDSVAKLCERSTESRGVKAVITYNYDNLLEIVLDKFPNIPVYKTVARLPKKLPIYHVHGYVPFLGGGGSKTKEIVFTEDQYHLSARDAYAWPNLVQVQALSGSVGLMIGLSLTDRNLRRLLDAIVSAPIRSKNYVLLQRTKKEKPKVAGLDAIHKKAKEYYGKFEQSGIKGEGVPEQVLFRHPGVKSEYPLKHSDRLGIKGEATYRREIRGIIEQVKLLDREEKTYVLEALGVTPIWYDKHTEIPSMLANIVK